MPKVPKRRRLIPATKVKSSYIRYATEHKDREVTSARFRLKGALLDALETANEDSDVSSEPSPTKQDRNSSYSNGSDSEDELPKESPRKQSPSRQSYVLKLFDRSVDLSQFNEESPLYPICRAWIANKPKTNYKKNHSDSHKEPEWREDGVDLPGPEGSPISRIPKLLPEQQACSKDNININYREAPPPTKQELLAAHMSRWTSVRRAWLQQGARVERRYEATQRTLDKIIVSNY